MKKETLLSRVRRVAGEKSWGMGAKKGETGRNASRVRSSTYSGIGEKPNERREGDRSTANDE